MTDLKEAIDLLSTEDGLLNRISRHNADEFVEAVALVCDAARSYVRMISEAHELIVVEKVGSYGRASIIEESDVFFVDVDHEVATELEPGRYLVVPLSTTEEK